MGIAAMAIYVHKEQYINSGKTGVYYLLAMHRIHFSVF